MRVPLFTARAGSLSFSQNTKTAHPKNLGFNTALDKGPVITAISGEKIKLLNTM